MPLKEPLEVLPVRVTGEVKRRILRMAGERGETTADFLRRRLSEIAFREEAGASPTGEPNELLLRGLEAVAQELRDIRSDLAKLNEYTEARHREFSRSLARAFEALLRASAVDSQSRFTRDEVKDFIARTFGGRGQ
jgi:DNA-binding transcriptional ArsR family regulator